MSAASSLQRYWDGQPQLGSQLHDSAQLHFGPQQQPCSTGSRWAQLQCLGQRSQGQIRYDFMDVLARELEVHSLEQADAPLPLLLTPRAFFLPPRPLANDMHMPITCNK